MFKLVSMRRAERACNDITEILQAVKQGSTLTLALVDTPYPYAVPVNYAPMIEDNELYLIFHGAKAGRRYELITRDPHVAFSIVLQGRFELKEPACTSSTRYVSICGDGIVEIWREERALNAMTVLMQHLGSALPADALKTQLRRGMKHVACCALKIERAGLKRNVA